MRLSSIALTAATAVVVGTVPALPASAGPPGAAAVDVPIAGQALMTQNQSAGGPVAVATVHAVRRTTKGTVLYWSVGYPQSAQGTINPNALFPGYSGFDPYSFVGATRGVALVDVAGRKAYEPMAAADRKTCLCSKMFDISRTPGDVSVLWAVMPELPPGVSKVDVRLGFGAVIPAVPVEDGLLTPAAPTDGPMKVGQSWPQIDEAAVASAPEPTRSIYPLETRKADEDGTVTEVERPDELTLNLNTSVLFAVDSASLKPAATSALREVAATINGRVTSGGTLQIVGHTDSDGSNTYNLRLSQQRAQAVANALRPLVKAKVAYSVSGKGETQPIASNSTAAGKQKNRRVAVTFKPSGGAR